MADPGFPRGGGAPTYEFVEFSQKLHEIERIWTRGEGGASPAPLLDPPLVIIRRLALKKHCSLVKKVLILGFAILN